MTHIWKHLQVVLFGLMMVSTFASSAAADQLSFSGVYSTDAVMGGVYSSPYWVTIDEVSTLAICDDFETEVPSTTWQAIQYSLSDVSSTGPQKFRSPQPDGTTLTIEQEYYAAAWLAVQLMQSGNLNNPTLAGYYSYAIWTIFDPGAIGGYHGNNSGIVVSEIDKLRNEAFAQALNPTGPAPDVVIYTPNPSDVSQEFLVVKTPEPSTVAILVLNLLGIAGLVFFLRRRFASKLSH